MIALELRINQTFGTFTGDCIIIIFLPNTIICPRNTILPYTIWTASHPTHTGTLGLRIRESKAKIQHFRVRESIVEATTTGSSVQQHSIHREQSVRRQTPNNRVRRTTITGTKNRISIFRTSRQISQHHLHPNSNRAIFQRNDSSVNIPRHRSDSGITLSERDSDGRRTQRNQSICFLNTAITCSRTLRTGRMSICPLRL